MEYGQARRIGGNAGVTLSHADGPMNRGGHGQWDEGHMPKVRERTTIDWQPTCSCQADICSGIVCDPFMGSGTTALVARRLGRHYVGCDVNPEYVALAHDRLTEPYTLPMFV